MTPETSRTITITLGGRERRLWYNFAALSALGAKGPADGEALGRAFQGAAEDFDQAAKLVQAGMLYEKNPADTVEAIREAIVSEWDMPDLIKLIETFGAVMNGSGKEGENRPDPPSQESLSPGTAPAPSAESISA